MRITGKEIFFDEMFGNKIFNIYVPPYKSLKKLLFRNNFYSSNGIVDGNYYKLLMLLYIEKNYRIKKGLIYEN